MRTVRQHSNIIFLFILMINTRYSLKFISQLDKIDNLSRENINVPFVKIERQLFFARASLYFFVMDAV